MTHFKTTYLEDETDPAMLERMEVLKARLEATGIKIKTIGRRTNWLSAWFEDGSRTAVQKWIEGDWGEESTPQVETNKFLLHTLIIAHKKGGMPLFLKDGTEAIYDVCFANEMDRLVMEKALPYKEAQEAKSKGESQYVFHDIDMERAIADLNADNAYLKGKDFFTF